MRGVTSFLNPGDPGDQGPIQVDRHGGFNPRKAVAAFLADLRYGTLGVP